MAKSPKMVYNEWYGEIPFTLNRTIKKFNVSPSDYDLLCEDFGRENHAVIEAKIKEWSPGGYYQMPVGAWFR